MTKHFVIASLLAMATATTSAQTLFTYGTDSVTVQDFLAAYHKNNATASNEKAKNDYLQLYIVSRLKIREARERGYETLPHMQAEIKNLREQILPAYLKDEESFERLVREAQVRSQKDIALSHIFISIKEDGNTNAAATKLKAEEALAQLQKGKSFAEVARQYSDDPSAATNGGKIGYITAFTLPYELENIAYNTPAGKFSAPYLSKSGYHIFKNDGERHAWGRIRAAQILLAFPPDADTATEARIKNRADSLYNRLLKGDDLGGLAAQFSNDAVSAQAEGQMPEISVGQYSADFENAVFTLPKDGAISVPFKTAHGYHIVKRLAKIPVTVDDKGTQAIRESVEKSEDRMATMQAALIKKVLKEAPFKKGTYNEADLWAYSDSVMDGKKSTKRIAIHEETELFTLGETPVTVDEWITFAQTARYENDGSAIKPYAQVWTAFVDAEALKYYGDNLEIYNTAFRQQLEEFKEGSLFFEIMQREVWNGAHTDSMALLNYYNAHKAAYVWQKSADAVLVYANDLKTAKALQTTMAKAPKNWRKIMTVHNAAAVADSGRFELGQLPGTVKGVLKAGSFTQPTASATDNNFAFAYIVKLYPQPALRTFAEARSLVMNDYQQQVEKEWIESLKKKYEVKINPKTLELAMQAPDPKP